MGLPTRLRDARKLIESLDYSQIEASVATEGRARLAIIGPVNSGKSTLFNRLKGEKLSDVSPVPGTTSDVIAEEFGPFVLVDTPGFGEVAGEDNAALARSALHQADTVVLVLDASAGVRTTDQDLLQRVKMHAIPVVVVLNKIDLLGKERENVVRDIERKLQVPVIPISAKKGTNVGKKLLPAIIDSNSRMAVTIGRALPQYRKIASRRIIRESSLVAAMFSFEPIPGLAIPLLIGVQVRMLLRLSTIYGADMSAARARELLSATAGGVAIRYAAQELAKFVPGFGWVVASVIALTGTTALGRVAVLFFETGQKLQKQDLRKLYKSVRWKRKRKAEQELEEHETRAEPEAG